MTKTEKMRMTANSEREKMPMIAHIIMTGFIGLLFFHNVAKNVPACSLEQRGSLGWMSYNK